MLASARHEHSTGGSRLSSHRQVGAATHGRRARARPDRRGASRSPVVAQAVRPAATGTPRRGRVAEGPSARSVPPGGVRARPAAQAGEVRPAGAVRPRSLQASRCAPRSKGALQSPQTCRRGRCRIVRGPSNSQSGTNGSTNMASSAARPTQGVGMSGISPPLGQGRGLLLLPHDVCGMGHCRRVSSITTAGGWCPESGFLTQPKLGPWL